MINIKPRSCKSIKMQKEIETKLKYNNMCMHR